VRPATKRVALFFHIRDGRDPGVRIAAVSVCEQRDEGFDGEIGDLTEGWISLVGRGDTVTLQRKV
jgi:hypothetical protein